MKKLILILAIAALFPSVSGSAEFSRHVSAETVIENRGGEVLLVARSDLSKRIERFAVKHGASPVLAPELAELISVCDHPRVLAAIAARESHFNDRARGRLGAIGMYQQRPDVHGHPGRTWVEQTRSAERLLNDLVAGAGGKLPVAARRYNGSGPDAVAYSKWVMKTARNI